MSEMHMQLIDSVAKERIELCLRSLDCMIRYAREEPLVAVINARAVTHNLMDSLPVRIRA